MRYITELDQDRLKWGRFAWVVDTTKTEIVDRLLYLLPEEEAKILTNSLNAETIPS